MKKSKSIFYNLYNVLRCKAYFDVMTPFSNAENNLIEFEKISRHTKSLEKTH